MIHQMEYFPQLMQVLQSMLIRAKIAKTKNAHHAHNLHHLLMLLFLLLQAVTNHIIIAIRMRMTALVTHLLSERHSSHLKIS